MTLGNFVHIVDDDAAIRDSLTLMLEARSFQVRAYESAPDFLERVRPTQSGCVVADLRMPMMDGIELMEKMRVLNIALPVVIITAYADVPLAIRAMKAGAIDLLEKPFENDALLAAVETAISMECESLGPDAETRGVLARFAALTTREKDVLTGILRGKSNKVVAYELGIAERTVELHRANIMAKMKTNSVAELVRMSLVALSVAKR